MRRKISFWFAVADGPIVALCLIIALLLVDADPGTYLLKYWLLIPVAVLARIALFLVFRLYRWVYYYFGSRELLRLVEAVTLGSIPIGFILLIVGVPSTPSVIIIDWMLNIILVGGLRFTARLIKELIQDFRAKKAQDSRKRKRTLIVGAGDAGEAIVNEIYRNPRLHYEAIGFVDDDQDRIGQDIHEIPVLGTTEYLPAICKAYGIEEILIAVPSASGEQMRDIVEKCEKCQVQFRTLPGLYEFIDGSIDTKQIRKVKIEDLLGREQHALDLENIALYLHEATVMVTGAAGSIGSELCRQIASFKPAALVLLDHEETNLYEIEQELKEKFPEQKMHLTIGNIRNQQEVENVISKYRPSTIFHAAAFKHVPLMEDNPNQAVLNNVMGTSILIDLAHDYEVDKFVLISTDKAVNPTSVMGTTKRIAEMLIQTKALQSKTQFLAVRFGNVLGSRGSVIPLFTRQIAQGGPVTVTHPETVRYFMTIAEAVQLILQACSIGEGGEVFVLDMGKPVKILDLAKDMIKLSGLQEGTDIEIKFVGLRPGEKLYEELLTAQEKTDSTQHEKIYVAKLGKMDPNGFYDRVRDLIELAKHSRNDQIRLKIKELVPSYNPAQNGLKELEISVMEHTVKSA
ncbi:MAG: polysaccharide biosynthesis protein [Chloroflexi bacterium]|nr:polysaccharide biosynthesis protein [Chloroflexota bacterium]MBT7079955.1 polysaccharide biosynthesis protein [Chloroflexota bacterium]